MPQSEQELGHGGHTAFPSAQIGGRSRAGPRGPHRLPPWLRQAGGAGLGHGGHTTSRLGSDRQVEQGWAEAGGLPGLMKELRVSS